MDPDHALRLLEETVRQDKENQLAMAAATKLRQDALESDEGLQTWIDVTYGRSPFPTPPIVRANVYERGSIASGLSRDGAGSVYGCQEIPSWRHGQWDAPAFDFCDERRPVYMRGSVGVCQRIWANGNSNCANGWCFKVVKRYLRRIKFTCFNREEFYNSTIDIRRKLSDKHYTTYHFGNDVGHLMYADDIVYLKGRRMHCTKERREKWLRARRARELASRVVNPSKISANVAQRALRELGVLAPSHKAVRALRSILDQPEKGMPNA
jgi:hypothetical protein